MKKGKLQSKRVILVPATQPMRVPSIVETLTKNLSKPVFFGQDPLSYPMHFIIIAVYLQLIINNSKEKRKNAG